MRLLQNGNLGIGTDSPNGKLQFENSANTRKIVLYEGANNDYEFYGFGVESQKLIYSVYTNTDDHVFVSGVNSTSRNELMRIEGGGNVGIGTTSPDAKLHVSGSTGITIENTSSTNVQLKLRSNGVDTWRIGQNLQVAGATALEFYDDVNNVDRMVITNSGLVGIGTTSPDEKLDVDGKVQVTGTSLTVLNASDPNVTVSDTDTNYKGAMRWLSSSNVLEFFTRYGGTYYTNNLVLDRGKVGIGTDSPQGKLDSVAPAADLTDFGRSTGSALNIRIANVTGHLGQINFCNDAAPAFGYGSIGMVMTSGSGVGLGDMVFGTKSSGSAVVSSERMRIKSDGTVIIGAASSAYNTTQGYSFHAVADYTAQSYISIARKGQTSGSQGVVIGLDTANAYIQVRDNINLILGTNNNGMLIIQPNGNVGLGTSTPFSRLDVTGVLSIGVASSDPSFTVASTGMSLINGGSLDIVQGFAGTSSAGDTLVFKYEATSWKAWQLEYCISAAYGFLKGGVGGYLNTGTPNAYYYITTSQGSNMNISSVVATSGGASNQHIIITITGVFGIHTCVRMKYTQSGGDGAPRADRASLTFNS